MAGLLDPGGPFDLTNPQTQMAIGLLMGAQAPRSQGAQIFSGLLSQQAALSQQEMQRKVMQSQIEENALQNRQREQAMALAMQQQQSRQRALYGGGGVATGAAPAAGGGAAGEPGGIMGLAQRLGIAPEVVQADIEFNGGKKISELLESRSKPNWQNINGNLVNTNAQGFQGGIQDQVQLGPDGRATILRSNGGNPVMGAVPGSFYTYSAFKDIDNRTSARYSPGRPVLGPDGRQYGQSQLDEIGGGSPRPLLNPPGMRGATGPTNNAERGMAEQVAQVPYDVQKEIASVERELRSGGLSPSDRAQATAYLQNLRSQGAAPAGQTSSAAGALDFSPEEKAAQEAARVRTVEQTKADISPTKQRQNALASMETLSSAINSVAGHPGLSTGTGLQGSVDPRNYIPGTDATNFRVALDQLKGSAFLQAFENLKGGGAITEAEGAKATNAIARLNTAQSTPEFKKALNEFQAIVQGAQKRMNASGASQSGGATGGWDESPAKPVATMRFNPSTGRLEKVN